MLHLLQTLGRIPEFRIHGIERIEQTHCAINIISKSKIPIIKGVIGLCSALDNWGKMEGVFIWTQMLLELQRLAECGVFVIEASDFKHWYFDPYKRRLYFLAPHWLTMSKNKANTLGMGKFQIE